MVAQTEKRNIYNRKQRQKETDRLHNSSVKSVKRQST